MTAAGALVRLIAILIVVNVSLGWFGEDLPDDWVRPAIDTHKSIGIAVRGLLPIAECNGRCACASHAA